MELAISTLKKAVELDQNENYVESLQQYQKGIQMLLNIVIELNDLNEKMKMRNKIEDYISRAEKLKKIIDEEKDRRLNHLASGPEMSTKPTTDKRYFTHKQIIIKDDSIGNSYDVIFGSFFDDSVVEIQIDDAYIRTFHQCQNFLRFCELAVKSCKNLKRILLQTTYEEKSAQQKESLNKIQEDLQNQHNIKLDISYSSTLHDREIRLSNGFVIQIGRGLNYFKSPEDKFSLGYNDLHFRKCYETTVNIFHQKYVHKFVRTD